VNPLPLFLLTQHLSPKDIAGNDNEAESLVPYEVIGQEKVKLLCTYFLSVEI